MKSARISEILNYRFRDEMLLTDAITHPSRRSAHSKTSAYERLEFLGDRVLGLVIAEILLRAFPDESEGDLARRHAALVRAETCAAVAQQWELHKLLDAASSEYVGGEITNIATLSDAAEAIIGAIYLDSDFETVRAMITRFWSPLLNEKLAPPSEPKTELQEWAQGRGLPLPEYREVSRTGPDHAPEFVIEVSVKGHAPAQGSGNSRRAAEKAAAKKLLSQL
ncbi:MAG TPA: ribonuclease III [Rhodospirillaceae bacterium]|nr:ribonuclease III [Rhodospirillaceae bacterium]